MFNLIVYVNRFKSYFFLRKDYKNKMDEALSLLSKRLSVFLICGVYAKLFLLISLHIAE